MHNLHRRGGIRGAIHQGGILTTQPTADGNLRQKTPIHRGILEVPMQETRYAAETIITVPPIDGWTDRAPERSDSTVPTMLCQLPAGSLAKMATPGRVRGE